MGTLASELEALQHILTDTNAAPTKIPYAVIKAITNNFSEEIGRGGFGVVYVGTVQNGKVAVKKLNPSLDFDDKNFLDEVTCLLKVKHKNIVRFLGYCVISQGELVLHNGRYVVADERQKFLCFEYVANGSLDHYIKEKYHGDDCNIRYQVIMGICQGLHYLHKHNINHLDLKPENILLDANMEPKITDFGLSRCFDDKQSRIFTQNISGTLRYMAPELIDEGEISFKTDIYSLGIIMMELTMGPNKKHSTSNGGKSLGVDCLQMKKCVEIAQRCVNTDQLKRPFIHEIINELSEIETMTTKVPPVISKSTNHPGSSVYQISSSALSSGPLQVHPHKLFLSSEPNNRMPFLLQLTNRTDDWVAFMFLDLGKVVSSTPCRSGVIGPRSTWCLILHLGAEEQAVPEKKKKSKNMVLVRTTIVTEGFNPDHATTDMFVNKQTYMHDLELDVVFIPPTQPQTQLDGFDKLHLGADKEPDNITTKTCLQSITTGLLDVYPAELRFPFKPDTYTYRSIYLTNKTDDEISFWITTQNMMRYRGSGLYNGRRGTVASRSTCAVTLTIKEKKMTLPEKDTIEIMMATSRSLGHLHFCNGAEFIKGVRKNGGKVHVAILLAVIDESESDPADWILVEESGTNFNTVAPVCFPNDKIIKCESDLGQTNPSEQKLKFARSLNGGIVDKDLKKGSNERKLLQTNTKFSPTRTLEVGEKHMVALFHFSVTSDKKALTRFVRSVDWSNNQEAKKAVEVMGKWETIDVADVLELLLPDFESDEVCGYAVRVLERFDDEEIQCYLLHLVHALRFQRSDKSHLALFLVERALSNIEIASFLRWYLLVELHNPSYAGRYYAIYDMLEDSMMKLVDNKEDPDKDGFRLWQSLTRQSDLIAHLSAIMNDIRTVRGGARKKIEKLRQLLLGVFSDLMSFDEPIRSPLSPTLFLTGIVPQECAIFRSVLHPLCLAFNTANGGTLKIIYKKGDDLRQDQLVTQAVSLIDRLLKLENLDLHLTTYRVLATGQDEGMLEFIPASSLAQILSQYHSITNYLQKFHPDEDGPFGITAQCLETFIKSCAGFSVITYILGVGDRHLDNILLRDDGRLFHVDFAFILGRDPKPFPPPMKLCKEMVEAMGGAESQYFTRFKSYCCEAYNILRKSSSLILNLFKLMNQSGIPDISGDESRFLKLQEKFRLDLDDEEATNFFLDLINESVSTLFPLMVETIHRWSQYWR